jgi:hypothetical protein
MPRSARSSSTSRNDRPNRRYQRTASTITSDGKQKPAKADRGMVAGRGRRVLMTTVCLLRAARSPMESSTEHAGELAIDLANTLQLQRDGTTVDLLADQDGPAAHPAARGGDGGQPGRRRRAGGRPAGGRRAGGPLPCLATRGLPGRHCRLGDHPGGRPQTRPAAAVRSARLWPLVPRLPAATTLVLTGLRQPGSTRPVPPASPGHIATWLVVDRWLCQRRWHDRPSRPPSPHRAVRQPGLAGRW